MINRYGMVLISYTFNDQRKEWAKRSFDGLCKTNVTGMEPIFLQLTFKDTGFDYYSYRKPLSEKFFPCIEPEPDHVKGLDPVFIWSADKVAAAFPQISHLIFMTDDVLYNPEWLQQLDGLIQRHPQANAYTVYRSSYERHHKTVFVDGNGDVQVTSVSGIGTMRRQEWLDYGPDWRRGHGGFSVPDNLGGGDTVDLHHAWARPGERWSTPRSYWQHIGMVGTHGNCDMETAIDFVGE